jgi:hypothetical protein
MLAGMMARPRGGGSRHQNHRTKKSKARDFVAHEFRRHKLWNGGSKAFAVRDNCGGIVQRRFARHIFAMRDVDHLRRNNPGAREFKLGDHLAGAPGAQSPRCGAVRR